ncbi:MAG: hypothetical protein ACRYGP_12540 [Janthinobacterium lividum]
MNAAIGVRALAFSATVCAPLQAQAELVHFAGGNGISPERAVIIVDAANETEGIRAEHVWQARVHPRWQWREQAVFRRDGHMFDLITLRGPDGPHEVWFDITSFFGKS